MKSLIAKPFQAPRALSRSAVELIWTWQRKQSVGHEQMKDTMQSRDFMGIDLINKKCLEWFVQA